MVQFPMAYTSASFPHTDRTPAESQPTGNTNTPETKHNATNGKQKQLITIKVYVNKGFSQGTF